jgi:predicted ArsR family transcriptional regulator
LRKVNAVTDDFASQVAGIGALAEPARRALYLYVVAQPEPVSRDQAAAGAGLPRHAAKFHLDKLVDEGLLETEFRRLSGRQGPGAGRPSKLYRRSARQVSVTLPERRYDLAGTILARAVEDAASDRKPVLDAVAGAARNAGRSLAAEVRAGGWTKSSSPLASITEILASQGYEPRTQAGEVVLANCPFHSLAREHTQLVCGMNREVIAALAEALGHDEVSVRLDPGPDRCCVTLGLAECPPDEARHD